MRKLSLICLMFPLICIVKTACAKDKVDEHLNIIEPFANACQQDMKKLCNEIKPGEGRILNCLYSYQDKLSVTCKKQLLDADPKLKQYAKEMGDAAYACIDDFEKFCTGTTVGQSRYIDCLKKNRTEVSSTCKEVLRKVGYVGFD